MDSTRSGGRNGRQGGVADGNLASFSCQRDVCKNCANINAIKTPREKERERGRETWKININCASFPFFLLQYTIYNIRYIYSSPVFDCIGIISQCQREMAFCQLPPLHAAILHIFPTFSNTLFLCVCEFALCSGFFFSSSLFFSLCFADFLWAISFVIKTTIVIQRVVAFFVFVLLKGFLDLRRWQFTIFTISLVVFVSFLMILKVSSISSQWEWGWSCQG